MTNEEKRENVFGHFQTVTKSDFPIHCTCYYCGLSHREVEAGGMWRCPNIACKGPGNANWRKENLKSYVDKGHYHTVDLEEWVKKIEEQYETLDEAIQEAVKDTMKKISTRALSNKFGI